MKFAYLISISIILSICIASCKKEEATVAQKTWKPHTGQIQILNGCGLSGVAEDLRSFLASNGFDIVEFGNAAFWNYPKTLVIGRTATTQIASDLGQLIGTDQVITLIDSSEMVEATIIIGKDFYQLMEKHEQNPQ